MKKRAPISGWELLSFKFGQYYFPQHFLYLLPLPQGHGSFLPILLLMSGLDVTIFPSVKYQLPSSFLNLPSS
jgi:hypothetical protein